jgi:hypothetical protein
MHADHHACKVRHRPCMSRITVPYYTPHRPPLSTILAASLLHANGHRKQADGTVRVLAYKKARRVSLPQQHAQLATRFTCLSYTVYGHAHELGSTVVVQRGEQPMSIPLLFPLFQWSFLYFPPWLCLCRATLELYVSSAMMSSKHEARRNLVPASLFPHVYMTCGP